MHSIAVSGLAAFFAVLALTSCGGDRDPERAGSTSPEVAPNVLLYVIDSLRADSLGYAGDPTVRTPHIDRFAREAMVFEQAYAQSSWTRPSMASIFTGTYPSRHRTEDRLEQLPSDVQTVAEILRDAGYATAHITTNPNVASFFGFSQGFDHTVQLFARSEPGAVLDEELIATSDEVTEKAIEWLRDAPRPFFLAILTVDPHAPYRLPAGFPRRRVESFDDTRLGPSPRTRGSRRPKMSGARSRYRSLISINDEAFGLLIEYLREARILDDTIAIFTSDHGEEFGEHGSGLHGRTLYEEVLHVPLLLRYPRSDRVKGGTRVDRPVRSVDIAPTVLDLAGLAMRSPMDGRSLLSESAERAPAIYSSLRLGIRHIDALRDYPWKLVVDRNTGESRIFHLADDPEEQAKRTPTRDPVAAAEMARLAGQLDDVASVGSIVPERGAVSIPDDARKTLEVLGYLESSAADREDSAGQ